MNIKKIISAIVFVSILVCFIPFIQGAPTPNPINPVIPVILSANARSTNADTHTVVNEVYSNVSDNVKVQEIRYLISRYSIDFVSYDDENKQINLFLTNNTIHRYTFKNKTKYELLKQQVQQQYLKDEQTQQILKIVFIAGLVIIFTTILIISVFF